MRFVQINRFVLFGTIISLSSLRHHSRVEQLRSLTGSQLEERKRMEEFVPLDSPLECLVSVVIWREKAKIIVKCLNENLNRVRVTFAKKLSLEISRELLTRSKMNL